jgi:hypothetical protein
MSQENKVLEYPTGLSSIPYASFLQIEKYSYDEAQKNVAKSFNDASGSIQRSFVGGLVQSGGDFISKTYGSGTPTDKVFDERMGNLYTTVRTETIVDRKLNAQQERSGKFSNKTILVEGGKDINLRTDTNLDRNIKVQLDNGEVTTVGQLLDEKERKRKKKNKGLMASRCMLPLPNEFQYKYGADWNNEFKLGTLALAADEAGKFAGVSIAGGAAGFLGNFIGGSLQASDEGSQIGGVDATKLITGFAGGAKFATNPFNVNSPLDPKNLAGLAGLAPNENSIQFFERMQGREFSFRFELAARNKPESNRIITIIEWFKRGMHPNAKSGRGSAVVLTFPDVFVLTPKFVKCDEDGDPLGDPIQHPMMPKTKLCALTGMTINTTPFGQLQTVFDGSIPIVTMELQFKETTKLTRVDMEGATFTEDRNSTILKVKTASGGFIADPDAKFIGEVSY